MLHRRQPGARIARMRRQAEIEQRQLRTQARGDLDGFDRIARFGDVQAAAGEERGPELPQGAVVFHQEHARRALGFGRAHGSTPLPCIL